MEHVTTFVNESSVHGVRFLKRKYKKWRFVWAVLLSFSTTLCWYQIGVNIRSYLAFDVSIKVMYSALDDVQFPAITIWNSNYLRRTVVGRKTESQIIMAHIFGLNFEQVLKTCNSPRKEQDNIDEMLDKGIKDVTNVGFSNIAELLDQVLSVVEINREMTFVRCWWQQHEINCSNIVLNSLIEENNVQPTMSVNLGPALVDMLLDKKYTGFNFDNRNYKLNATSENNGKFGIQRGYKFLLNVNSDEYCLQRNKYWHGVGFHAIFHDPEIMPSNLDGPQTVYLKPGFDYSVEIKPKKFLRKTEHIGKCLTNYPLYLFQRTDYSKKFCQLQCVYETVWEQCECVVNNFPVFRKALADRYAVHLNDTVYCWGSDIKKSDCVFRMGILSPTYPIEKFCPQCIQPCSETVYEYDVTALAFSEKSENYIASKLNYSINGGAFVKNFIFLNVYFGSKSINLIEEVQKYTLQELFVYIGNSLCLFLGISFVSAHEILFYLILPIHKEIVKAILLHIKKKVRKKWRAVEDVVVIEMRHQQNANHDHPVTNDEQRRPTMNRTSTTNIQTSTNQRHLKVSRTDLVQSASAHRQQDDTAISDVV